MTRPADRSAPQALLRRMFDAAIASAQPALCIPRHLPEPPRGRLLVIGAGKASAAMAQAVEAHWRGPLSGLVVTRYGYAVPCRHIEIVEASHPVPDAAGLRAAERMLALVQGLSADDLVLCLISGGGSSLLPLPAAGLTLQHKQDLNRALLKSGATIGEMNCVRRHLSAIKGGRLAAACYPGAGADAADFRRARRRPDQHRLRPHGARPDHLRRCAGHRAPLRHRAAARGARAARKRRRRVGQARRSAPGRRDGAHDRGAADGAGGRGGGGPRGRVCRAHPRRCARRRGA